MTAQDDSQTSLLASPFRDGHGSVFKGEGLEELEVSVILHWKIGLIRRGGHCPACLVKGRIWKWKRGRDVCWSSRGRGETYG